MSPSPVTEQRPHELVWGLTNGVVLSKCLHAVAELGVAVYIDHEAVSADELAARCGAHGRGRMLDVIMLAISGGRERTVHEFDDLFRSTGFADASLIETAGALRMVETTAV